MTNKLILALITLLTCTQLVADARIETTDARGERSSFTSNGKFARIDNTQDPSYVLINLTSNTFDMVDPRRRQIMRMDITAEAGPAGDGAMIKPQLKKLGSGPNIAGYSTIKYSMSANGQLCDTVYASKKVAGLQGVSELFESMRSMQQNARRMAGAFRSMMDPCTQARMDSDELYARTGAPLRIVNARGEVESEVTRIDTNASVAAGYYDAPAGFQVVSMDQQMNQARDQMQQFQNSPEMQQMMQQMQQQMQQMQGQRGAMPPTPPTAPGASEGDGGMQDILKQIQQMQQMQGQPAQ